MTPLQKAATALMDAMVQTDFTCRLGEELDALEKALTDEQAQAVEPVAWMHPSRDPHLVSHSAYTYGSASVPLFTHPAPPVGEHVPEADFGNIKPAPPTDWSAA